MWKRIKKYPKIELTEFYEVNYCLDRLILAQRSGYSIEIIQIAENKAYHQIQSIYKLLLVGTITSRDELILHYSHDELNNELLCYHVTDTSISKSYVPAP